MNKKIIAGLFGTVAFGVTAAPARPPNVVLIVADDLGLGDVSGFYKDAPIRTPNIDRLAKDGVKFTSFHVNPLCTPTRQCMMTGQYTFDNEEPGGAPAHGIKQDAHFISQMLHDAGYRTGAFGKWHLGEDDDDHPTARGFDEWIGFHGGSMEYHYDLAKEKSIRSKGANNTIYNGTVPYEKKWEHTTDLFSDEAIRFIGENKDRPFFLYLAYNAVHGPLWTPERPVFSGRADWVERIKSQGVSDNQAVDYYAVVEHMDERIGSVLSALAENGVEQNTLVIFMSDNGPVRKEFFYEGPAAGSSAGLRGGKSTVYEGGIHVPMIMKRGAEKNGRTVDDFTMHADLLPTCLEAAGIPVPENNGPRPLRGHSLMLYLTGSAPKQIDRAGIFTIGGNWAVIQSPWKLVNMKQRVGRNTDPATSEGPTDGDTLYNLAEDRGEKNNVAGEYPERIQKLRRIWLDYSMSVEKKRKN